MTVEGMVIRRMATRNPLHPPRRSISRPACDLGSPPMTVERIRPFSPEEATDSASGVRQ